MIQPVNNRTRAPTAERPTERVASKLVLLDSKRDDRSILSLYFVSLSKHVEGCCLPLRLSCHPYKSSSSSYSSLPSSHSSSLNRSEQQPSFNLSIYYYSIQQILLSRSILLLPANQLTDLWRCEGGRTGGERRGEGREEFLLLVLLLLVETFPSFFIPFFPGFNVSYLFIFFLPCFPATYVNFFAFPSSHHP